MPRLPRGSALAVAPVLIWLALAQIKETAQPQPTPYRISGRVEELYPGLGLMLGSAKGETSYAKVAVPVAPDGAFVTRPLASGVHVLELVEPSSPEPTSRGVRIVHVTSSDINGIVLRPLPRYALTGRFRMESDNRAAVWPPHIVVDRDHDRLYVKATGSAGGWHPETWLFEYHLRQRRENGRLLVDPRVLPTECPTPGTASSSVSAHLNLAGRSRATRNARSSGIPTRLT